MADAFRLGGRKFGERAILSLRDLSDDGLGARSDRAIEPGTLVSVGFRSPGGEVRRGTVLRCRPCGDGYEVAIQFEHRLAA